MKCGTKRIVYVAVVVSLFVVVTRAPSLMERVGNRTTTAPPYSVSAETRLIHDSLLIADLHCDSLLWNRNLLRRSSVGHVDVPRLLEANVALQAFTVVTQVPLKRHAERIGECPDMVRFLAIAARWPPRTWNSLKQRALYEASQLHKYAAASKGRLVIIESASDLNRFIENRTTSACVAGYLGIEGAQALEGRLENLDEFFAAGFRMMSPTHFTDTAIAGSASGKGQGGLTPLGREWVRRMETKGMLIDLAHASPATVMDVVAMATRPILVSHTGVRGTCDSHRNLSDDEIRAVVRTGGVIGIGYWPGATGGHDAKAVARAVRHAVNVAGVEHVCLGSDFDGATTMPFDVTGLPLVTEALMGEGFTEAELRLIMGGNVIRILLQALPEK